ncbi:MAG: hypothetical protein LUI10_03035 [Lachnospiraceae bacterium]|nr:hypothetical protein [Lachnospiraceae bacterium]
MADTVSVWQTISGSGALSALYLCAVIFLLLTEKIKSRRLLFVYFPLILTAVLLCPVTYRIFSQLLDEEIYYRFYWMLPMTSTLAYSGVRLYELYRGRCRPLVGAAILALFILCGDYVYDSWQFSAAENEYHIPQAVVDICDQIHREGKEVVAVFPSELMQYVRQYDCTICMPYGRDMLYLNMENELYSLMEETEEPDAGEICRLASESGCAYIVVSWNKKIKGSLQQNGYVYVGTVDAYALYFNEDMLIG